MPFDEQLKGLLSVPPPPKEDTKPDEEVLTPDEKLKKPKKK